MREKEQDHSLPGISELQQQERNIGVHGVEDT